MADQEKEICRICQDDQDNGDKMIKPCNCTQLVHQKCIQKWYDLDNNKCEVCTSRFATTRRPTGNNKVLEVLQYGSLTLMVVILILLYLMVLIFVIGGETLMAKIVPNLEIYPWTIKGENQLLFHFLTQSIPLIPVLHLATHIVVQLCTFFIFIPIYESVIIILGDTKLGKILAPISCFIFYLLLHLSYTILGNFHYYFYWKVGFIPFTIPYRFNLSIQTYLAGMAGLVLLAGFLFIIFMVFFGICLLIGIIYSRVKKICAPSSPTVVVTDKSNAV